MEEKEIDINNENEILEKFDFNYCYNSEKCSRELCMFFNDVCMTKRKNFDKRQALIDLGIIAITLNQQSKHIKDLERENQQLKEQLDNIDFYREYCRLKSSSDDLIKGLTEQCQRLKQLQNQLVISELEKVKNYVDGRTYLAEYICNRIKEFKGEKL